MKNKIIPELLQKRSQQRSLRIWCAACSTGQEPYSIAMLLQENFLELATWSVEILGTDLCSETITKTEKAQFNPFKIARGLSDQLQARYFASSGKDWVLRENIRSKVPFRKMNL